jgi:hypothetical protein
MLTYKKLNLIDGPDTDLANFFRLLKEALEAKKPGSSAHVNIELLSKIIATGTITGHVAEVDGEAVALQIWEAAQFWFDTSTKFANLRLQYMAYATPAEQVGFMQWGAAQAQEGVSVITTIDAADQLYPILPHCGLEDFGHVKRL